ncbi:MAG TPA: MMPL family transporter [Polyangiaceae bacterium]
MSARRFVDWTLRHGRLLWVVALLLAIPAVGRTGWLFAHLRSDLEELLPKESPSVVALDELKRRLSGRQYLGVVVDTGTSAAVPDGERFLDDLASRVRAYPSGMVASVRTGNAQERAFLDRHGAMYLDMGDLEAIRTRLEARRDYEVSRETGALIDEDEPPPSVDFSDIRAKYEGRLGGSGAANRGSDRYTNAAAHLSVLLIELGGFSSGADAAGKMVDRVAADVARLRATGRYPPSLRVGFAGDAAISAEELRALLSDLSWSSVVVVLAVMAAIVVYFRWWPSVLVVTAPLLLATAYSFGAASLPPFRVAAVNSNTAFLGSIIVGNGINFGIVLLSRYVEERRAGFPVRASLERAVSGARTGTLAAASAAAVSYGALAITRFQGFRQFGFIGGLGMVFAWCLAFLLMPSLIAWLDSGARAIAPRPAGHRAESTRFTYWVSRAVARAPRAVLFATLALTAVATFEVAGFRESDIESDFSRLRRRDTWEHGEGYWGRKMDLVLGRYLQPLVFLADDPEDARSLAAALRAHLDQAPLAGRIDSVRTIDDVLPARQSEKLAEIAAIQDDLTPAIRAAMAPAERDYVNRLLGESPRPVTLEDLPRSFTLGLRERDGSVDKVVLVYPKPSSAWWDANAMESFVGALRTIARDSTSGPRAPRLAGSLPLSADIVAAVRHDGPIASLAALAGVIVTVLLLLRDRRSSALVVGALVVGVLWMAGFSHLLGVRVNFANFIAFPITFGIGVDYAVNVVSRHKRDGGRDILGAVRSTGAAVALCSLTTIIGYSSLLMAQNRALFLFGLLAVMGEVACLTVALVSLPALLLAVERVRHAGRNRPPPRDHHPMLPSAHPAE